MTDTQLGAAVRRLRVRRRWRQVDLAHAAHVSQPTVSRIERGHFESHALETVRRVFGALDTRLEMTARWRGGDLDRMLNASHNAMHEVLARQFRNLPGWTTRAEVSFSRWGERGVIDVLAWHPARRALLVIELKTDVVDAGGLIAQVDRYERLAPSVGGELGWEAATVSCWVVVADSEANRHRIADHHTVLRGRFPMDGRSIRGWLADPGPAIDALTFVTLPRTGKGRARRRGRPAWLNDTIGRST